MNELRSLEGLGYLLRSHSRAESQASIGTHSRNRSYDLSALQSPFNGPVNHRSSASTGIKIINSNVIQHENEDVVDGVPVFTRATSMSVHLSKPKAPSDHAKAKAKQQQIMNSDYKPNFYRAISTKSVDPSSIAQIGTSYQFPLNYTANNNSNNTNNTNNRLQTSQKTKSKSKQNKKQQKHATFEKTNQNMNNRNNTNERNRSTSQNSGKNGSKLAQKLSKKVNKSSKKDAKYKSKRLQTQQKPQQTTQIQTKQTFKAPTLLPEIPISSTLLTPQVPRCVLSPTKEEIEAAAGCVLSPNPNKRRKAFFNHYNPNKFIAASNSNNNGIMWNNSTSSSNNSSNEELEVENSKSKQKMKKLDKTKSSTKKLFGRLFGKSRKEQQKEEENNSSSTESFESNSNNNYQIKSKSNSLDGNEKQTIMGLNAKKNHGNNRLEG